MIEIQKRKIQRRCGTTKAPSSISNLDLMTTLSIELQRLNSEMILQRLPQDEALEVQEHVRLESARRSAILDAKKGLCTRITKADPEVECSNESGALACEDFISGEQPNIYPAHEEEMPQKRGVEESSAKPKVNW